MTKWKQVPMGELCNITSGDSDTKDAVPEGPYAFFDRSKTIKRSDRFLFDCEALIIPGEGKEFFPKQFEGKFDLHQRAYALFGFKQELDIRFLYHYLHHRADYFPSVAVGATVKSLRRRHFEDLLVPVAPVEEQRRIVALLDEAFAGIAVAKANAEQNLKNARALFESHLNAIFTNPGPDWNATTLGNAFDVRDGTHDSPKYHSEGFPLITSKNLKREGLSFENVKLISPQDYKKINERSAVHKGDVLFAMIGTIGNATLVEVEPEFAIKNVALFKNNKGQSGAFLKYYLNSDYVLEKTSREAKGTTQKFVGLGYLREFPICLPTPSEQVEIVRAIEEVETEGQRLESIYERKLSALDELKKSLLHKAFSGEL